MKIKNTDKKELRKEMLQRRNLLSKEQVENSSKQITDYVIKSDLFQNASNICVYQAFRNEVCCDDIVKEAFLSGKQVFVPVTDIVTKTMEFYEILETTQWKTGAYGILEPCIQEDSTILKEKALILMPGLLFDKEKHRIGYGGGYYDKYLTNHTIHIKIALCYDFQVIAELPYEEYDVTPDYIVTEQGIF